MTRISIFIYANDCHFYSLYHQPITRDDILIGISRIANMYGYLQVRKTYVQPL